MHRPHWVGPLRWLTAAALLGLMLAACGQSAVEAGDQADADTADEPVNDHGSGHNDDEDADDNHADDEANGHDDHGVYQLPDGVPVPSVGIEVAADPASGVNVHVDVTDYVVVPEAASTDPVPGEGHFHVYVDGKKVARFYNQDIHLPMDEGDHTIMVELSANNHAPYAVDGELITAVADITVSPPPDEHHHVGTVEAVEPVPTIDVTVTPDPKSGWNVHADIENLTFAPRSAGLDHVDGEGHLHLYVDGEKITRLYGEWWHLDPLPAGEHTITVEATANDHHPYVVDGQPLVGTATITATEEQAAGAADSDTTKDHDHQMTEGGVELLDMPPGEAEQLIEIVVADGEVEREGTRFAVDEGSTVGVVVVADVTELVHVHGYEILQPIGPGSPAEFVFTADSRGVFEVELEEAGLFLFDLQVS